MSCSIGGIILEHTPLWIDRNKYHDTITDVSTAVNGVEIVMNSIRGSHYPITLQSTLETGWIKGSTIVSLRALSSVVGAYYTLILNHTLYIVRFRNEQPGGSIQMETLLPHSNPGDDDWWIGTTYLMCVE